ncbi:hypothetical protein PsorP6_015997 [Peronosclerospora sorghi]|uniref:Uncharacterized protein n=1 Tax=Peronosclerospora sorghi TaxID=230839 RepID=A0ACC0WQ08_9STRA|nr:hypothetical protein PsorP6_015997 [Peronosclerospora sorghi]
MCALNAESRPSCAMRGMHTLQMSMAFRRHKKALKAQLNTSKKKKKSRQTSGKILLTISISLV